MTTLEIILVSIGLHALLWQLAESRLQAWGEKLLALLTGKPANQTRSYDNDGIPIVIYNQQGRQYNPLFVAAQAKRDYLNRADPARLSRFLLLTDWLEAHADITEDSLLLPYHFDLPDFGLQAPWFSPLAQAVTLACFAQRYAQSGESRWLDYCRKILRTLETDRGLSIRMPDGGLWFPEYPGTEKTHVLNGMIGVLLELDTCRRLTNLETAQTLFDKGYQTLIRELPHFDCHGFSFYSLDGTKAGRNYHQIHISQLRELQTIKPDPVLARYHRRWLWHDMIPVIFQLLYYPRPKRIAAFLFSWVGIWGVLSLLSIAVWRG